MLGLGDHEAFEVGGAEVRRKGCWILATSLRVGEGLRDVVM